MLLDGCKENFTSFTVIGLYHHRGIGIRYENGGVGPDIEQVEMGTADHSWRSNASIIINQAFQTSK